METFQDIDTLGAFLSRFPHHAYSRCVSARTLITVVTLSTLGQSHAREFSTKQGASGRNSERL